jgi:hypothetical protein
MDKTNSSTKGVRQTSKPVSLTVEHPRIITREEQLQDNEKIEEYLGNLVFRGWRRLLDQRELY